MTLNLKCTHCEGVKIDFVIAMVTNHYKISDFFPPYSCYLFRVKLTRGTVLFFFQLGNQANLNFIVIYPFMIIVVGERRT